jgi:DNA-directed RNA polymerase subunit RPC12/RpoP
MPRQRTEFGRCPRCGERVSVAVKETDYAWLIGDRYESECAHCGVALLWRFKDVGDWSAWAPIARECRIRLRPDTDPGPEARSRDQ